MSNLLFIHGFNSSPLSKKAQQTQKYIQKYLPEVRFHCPQLATNPKDAINQLEQYLKTSPAEHWTLIGSSLGGYFSTYLSEIYNLKAVLVNPAIKPYELLSGYEGEQINPYTQESYKVEKRYLDDLIAIEKPHVAKNNYMVMVQTGDEVLNYQEAVDKFQDSHLIVQQNGDHSFVNYEKMLPQIVEFLQLTA
ncbi:YqiA/YcfP family alpha/beta fold hydrolase [Colwellia sp. UCD-KL20]|uniref:YqiA/YcfP family alpha/beta fold hydrolase n=1 Tax=Colwellia sp. UCD-KL20 TaxID=1917165 RepID=UPI00257048A0|nr:YqiA/YcfP family alpha/beta fold hydrolase [Colwellia sp. UCD-KL20]